jgi:eukaryotic-like serine/threonine-protein kinase
MTVKTIAQYTILEKLGEGGMGIVYKARDGLLGRLAAIKILPPGKTDNPEHRARFIREAQTASALNHPNIITIYQIGEDAGSDFIAMEYVEGRSLAEMIGHKPLPLKQALSYAAQVAAALAAAHRAGIVHRDLKPGNVMIAPDGRAKVLDFGLAKLKERTVSSETESTVTIGKGPKTSEGVIVGTIAYMSPEQAQGLPVDTRSDIFAFGAMLYEMVTGRRAFTGSTTISTLAAIVRGEPEPASRIAPEIPNELERIIGRCLRKDPARRYQTAEDLQIALEDLKQESDSGPLETPPVPRAPARRRLALLLGAAVPLLCAAGAILWLRFRGSITELKPVPLVSMGGWASSPSFSPDGSRVAFRWLAPKEFSHKGNDDQCGIYIKLIGGGPPARLTRSESDRGPAWSPDDRNIAFMRDWGREGILLVPAIGGPERKLGSADSNSRLSNLSWTPDAKWLVYSSRDSPDQPYAIWALSVETGERRRILTAPARTAIDFPESDLAGRLSPDGRVLPFFSGRASEFALYAVRLTRDLRPEEQPRKLRDAIGVSRGLGIAWASEKEIVYSGASRLWRIPVEGRGSPQLLNWAPYGASEPAIARSQRRLVYTLDLYANSLWRLDLRTGQCTMLVSSNYEQRLTEFSPDGRKIAFNSTRSGDDGLWTCDADGKNCQELASFRGHTGGTPCWSPDGRWLAFDSRTEGKSRIFVVPPDGGTPSAVTDGEANAQVPSWSRDGRWIYFESDRSGQWRIWKAPAQGGPAVQVTRTVSGRTFESADSKYLYLASTAGKPGIFRVPVAGGEETQVVRSFWGGWPNFSVTAKGVYFTSDAKTVQLLDAASGKIRTIAKLDKNSVDTYDGISVSQDDAFMVFAQPDRDGADLMLVEGFR